MVGEGNIVREYYKLAIVLDGAASHRSSTQKLPENISLVPLPPYSPELNPIENFWKVLKQQGFYNQAFESLDQVEDHPEKLQSIVAFDWTLSAIKTEIGMNHYC